MSVLILDGHLKSALASVRSLGEKGVTPCVGAERGTALSLHSRYAHARFVYASPKNDPEQFLHDVENAAQKTGEKPVIYAFSDATLLLLAREYEKVRVWATLALPSLAALEIAADKQATYELAQRLHIPTISTYVKEQFSRLSFPAVVKNRHSIVWRAEKSVEGSAQFVFSLDELKLTVEEIKEKTGEAPLVMEFIRGEEYGIEMVCTKGKIIASFAHKRIRSLSPRGGAAVVKETAEETSQVQIMRSYAETLVRTLEWTGPIMVEFKVDAAHDTVLLMEINGRFWGSLPLAVAAGVDFPLIAYDLSLDTVKETYVVQTRKIRTRHFLGDCRWLFSVMCAQDPLRSTLYPSRLRALGDFATEFFKSRGDVFSWYDLRPSLFEYLDIIAKWKSKA